MDEDWAIGGLSYTSTTINHETDRRLLRPTT